MKGSGQKGAKDSRAGVRAGEEPVKLGSGNFASSSVVKCMSGRCTFRLVLSTLVYMKARSTLILSTVLFTGIASAQVTVDNTQTAAWLVQNVLTGPGVSISNVVFNGGPGNLVYNQCASFDGAAANVGVPLGEIGRAHV